MIPLRKSAQRAVALGASTQLYVPLCGAAARKTTDNIRHLHCSYNPSMIKDFRANPFAQFWSSSKATAEKDKDGSTPSAEANEATDETEANSDSKAEESATVEEEEESTAESSSDTSEMEAKVAALEEEKKELKDRILRTLAEMENVRMIAKRDVDNAKAFAISSFAKSMCEVADNLTLAINSVDQSKAESNADLKTLLEGVQLTDNQLIKAFKKQGLERFGTKGDSFDPAFHDALYTYDDTSLPDQSLGNVLKNGYSLNGRVIRPAQVGIAKGGPAKGDASSSDGEAEAPSEEATKEAESAKESEEKKST